ncbi:MAG: hypothetical protein M1825_006428 [Sarcosagium campestre]|nr:MAG: hypothetical protein M1825_006428 [Sarcosagium campestre]
MRSFISNVAAATSFLLSITATQASTLTPPTLPLIVRNPYLSLWLTDARDVPWNNWPMFYEGQHIGLSVLASLPETNTVYPLFGRGQDALDLDGNDGYKVAYPSFTGATFDASTTNLSYVIPEAGDLKIELSFLSPITPTSTLRQAIPASYVSVNLKGNVEVDIYIDLNGQWVSADRDCQITWQLTRRHSNEDGDVNARKEVIKTWQVKRAEELLFTEHREQAEWGTLHFSAPADARHESGTSALLRRRFSRTGTLQNVIDGEFRGIMEDEPVFAFSKSFNLTSNESVNSKGGDSIVFSIAHVQDPIAQFASARGLTLMRPLWASWFPSAEALTLFHYLDFSTAAALASNYSAQLAIDAAKSGSQNYVDILALSARQVLGATSFAGTPDNPILFLKEISSNGNFQTIDVIFPAFPFFLYTNPRWLAYLLEPLIEHMLSGQYPNDYAMHDLGYHFPNATGHGDGRDEYMPVEECGNILIMGLSIVNSLIYDTPASSGSIWSSSGSSEVDGSDSSSAFPLTALGSIDGAFGFDDRWGGAENGKGKKQARKYLAKSYRLWKQWTRYLVDFTLTPANQLSTDDFAGWLGNQTNLALKGILGIKAMSRLSETVGNEEDAKYYRNISATYIKKWEEYGLSRDDTHYKLAYEWYGSWTTLYNLFADSLLCFHISDDSKRLGAVPAEQTPLHPEDGHSRTGFVSEHVYKIQSDWYHNVVQRYGLPLDSRHLYTKSDWEFFAAAVTSKKVREEIVDAVALWVNETATDLPLTDLYDTEGNGGFPGITFKARPVVGGHFSFLALERACDGNAMSALDFLNVQETPERAHRHQGYPSGDAEEVDTENLEL